MENYRKGKVHWFSDEGIGYIVEDNLKNSIVFHYSVVEKKKKNEYVLLPEGQEVEFKADLFEGREVASEVIRI